MFEDFGFGDAFGAGVIGGFIEEATKDEDEKLRKLEQFQEEDEEVYIRIGSNKNEDRTYLSICDDSSEEEDLTDIKGKVSRALAYAKSKLEQKEEAKNERPGRVNNKNERPRKD